MSVDELIHQAYSTARNYPDLARKLIEAGVKSYSVDVSSGIIMYRLAAGKTLLHPGVSEPRVISTQFDRSETIEAIRENQEGKSDYPGFMKAIAKAGVRFYDAILNGDNKRVVYAGIGGQYEENIPIVLLT